MSTSIDATPQPMNSIDVGTSYAVGDPRMVTGEIKQQQPSASDSQTSASLRASKQQSCTTMTINVTTDNAKRMLEASRALNLCLLKSKSVKDDTCEGESAPITDKIILAARQSSNQLLVPFVNYMQAEVDRKLLTEQEMILSLLLFLDVDKSNKLLTAFEILSEEDVVDSGNGNINPDNENKSSDHVTSTTLVPQSSNNNDNKTIKDKNPSPTLKRTQLRKLFQSFLLSITACINSHHNESQNRDSDEIPFDKENENISSKAIKRNESDSPHSNIKDANEKDSSGESNNNSNFIANDTKMEIEEIANYAANKLMKDLMNKHQSSSADTENRLVTIGFKEFGEWYNTGGFSLVPWLELLDLAKWDHAGRSASIAPKSNSKRDTISKDVTLHNNSFPALSPTIHDLFLRSPTPTYNGLSEVLVTFDFPSDKKSKMNITRENIQQLHHLVTLTNFSCRSPKQISDVILRHSKQTLIAGSSNFIMALHKNDFNKCILDLIPSDTLQKLSTLDMDFVMSRFSIFFLCYTINTDLQNDYVNAKELSVGLSFLCFGSKSTKLVASFDLIGDPNTDFLSQGEMIQYFRSYLTMLVGISLLSGSKEQTQKISDGLVAMKDPNCKKDIIINQISQLYDSIGIGVNSTVHHLNQKYSSNQIYFDDLASWYSDGGFSIATWLEFLDLHKFISLLTEKNKVGVLPDASTQHLLGNTVSNSSSTKRRQVKKSALSSKPPSPNEILFTFPLANNQSLVVLREDASYIRLVVDNLGSLDVLPENIWKSICRVINKDMKSKAIAHATKQNINGYELDQNKFVDAIKKALPPRKKRKRVTKSKLTMKPEEMLQNFYQSFDLNQGNRVSANQLMGGLTLLCGGKKSTKLSFAFGLFDLQDISKKTKKQRNKDKALCGKELFYFFRSFLIVVFSCCKQSLDLSADTVGRYISDTANKVTDDVMKYQWRSKSSNTVTFDDFGEWYNEGGFEIAPWLELLDLNKWVLLDEAKAKKMIAKAKPMKQCSVTRQFNDKSNDLPSDKTMSKSNKIPPPPPDHEIGHTDTFLDDIDVDEIGGDIGDMGFFFPDTAGKENADLVQQSSLDLQAVHPNPGLKNHDKESNSIKFQLSTNAKSMYTVSISQQRVQLLRRLIIDSNLHTISFTTFCEIILKHRRDKQITKKRFDSAMQDIMSSANMSSDSTLLLSNLLDTVFNAFDLNKVEKVDASELACGLSVLCSGRKSDKLEFAFELLSTKNKRLLSRFQMVRYLQSFLLVLLNMSSCSLGAHEAEEILHDEKSEKTEGIAFARVICSTSSWITEEIFGATPSEKRQVIDGTEYVDFDQFADWYTRGGFSRITWLELLDLNKWVLAKAS